MLLKRQPWFRFQPLGCGETHRLLRRTSLHDHANGDYDTKATVWLDASIVSLYTPYILVGSMDRLRDFRLMQSVNHDNSILSARNAVSYMSDTIVMRHTWHKNSRHRLWGS